MIQPDGGSIRAVTRGDEFQNWTESTESGHTIIRNPTTGYWEYADQAKDGSLRPSGMHVLPNGVNAPASIPKGIRPPRNRIHELQMNQMIEDFYQQRSSTTNSSSATIQAAGSAPAPGDWVPGPVVGAKKLLVLLVSFANKPITTTPANWSTTVFDAAVKSVAKYYKENSFDSLTVTPVAHAQASSPAGIVSVSLASNHPNLGGNFTFVSDQAWGNSALQQAASFVDFNGLDTNSDGKLDPSEVVIYFIAAGYETSVGSGLSPTMWAHAWYTSGTGLTAGTKNVQRWALSGEYYNATTKMTMGVIAHELGHQMCGLPDLYDISNNNEGLGNFSIMASGSWGANIGEYQGTTPTALDAWSREYLGWATPVIAAGSGQISLGHALLSRSSLFKLIDTGSIITEYFLVENRLPTGWDLGLKSSLSNNWKGGLLITHIDNTAGTKGSNDINSYSVNITRTGHQGVVPVQASTALCNMLALGSTCRGHATTLFYSTNNASWTSTSTPNSNYYSGLATNFSLTGISAAGALMTANLSLGPPVVTLVDTPPALTNTQQASFAFTSSDSSATLQCKVDTASYAGCSSPHTTTALADGPHTFSVQATNSFGSTVSSHTWTIDTVPPDTTLDAVPQIQTAATSAVFSFSSPDATTTFQCQLDGGIFTSCSGGASYNNLSLGSHTFAVRAVDGSGNADPTPANYTWTIMTCFARIGSSCYASLGAAYAMANNGDTILTQAIAFPESLVANRGLIIGLHGGYDASFSTIIGSSSIENLTIGTDTLDVADLAL